jgi:hypothetical protein
VTSHVGGRGVDVSGIHTSMNVMACAHIPANTPLVWIPMLSSPRHFPAVVLLLSKELISKEYPMEELHLLLEWQRQHSPAKLLPVFYDLTWQDVYDKATDYKAAATKGSEAEQLRTKHWVDDLEGLLRITGIRKDQV